MRIYCSLKRNNTLIFRKVTMFSKQDMLRVCGFTTVAVMFVLLSSAVQAEWPQFRGVNGAGVATGKAPPVEFGPGKNEVWNTDIGSGHSSPCVVGPSIFLTAYDSESKKCQVLSINKTNGNVRWRREIKPAKIETGHPSFNPASSTPACDGKRVVAYFGSYGLVCFTVDGEKLWELKLPLTKSYSGNATSPIIVGDRVILYRANHVDHFLLALDIKTGKQLWKKPQAEHFTSAMSAAATPVVVGNTVIVHAVQSVKAFDIETGTQLWQANCSTTATSTPIIVGDEVVIGTWNQTGEPALVPIFPPYEKLVEQNDKDGNKTITKNEFPKLMYFHRSEGTEAPQNGAPLRFSHADKNRNGNVEQSEWKALLNRTAAFRKRHIAHGLVAIKIKNTGNLDVTKIRYIERKGIPEVPSPIHHDGNIYLAKNGGILSCIKVKTGERVYRIRTKGTGTHYASPIIAGNHLFVTSGDGKISVIKLGADAKILATNEMKEKTYATPAIVDGTIYIRTHSKIYAFTSKK